MKSYGWLALSITETIFSRQIVIPVDLLGHAVVTPEVIVPVIASHEIFHDNTRISNFDCNDCVNWGNCGICCICGICFDMIGTGIITGLIVFKLIIFCEDCSYVNDSISKKLASFVNCNSCPINPE